MPANLHFVPVAAGGNLRLALAPDGAAYVWDNNYNGEPGDGTTTCTLTFLRNFAHLPATPAQFTARPASSAAVALAWV